MVEVKEYEKSDKSIAIAKRLQVTLIVDGRAGHGTILAEAKRQLEIYQRDAFCGDKIVGENMFQEYGFINCTSGYEKEPDVVWLDIATSKEKADEGKYKFHLLWINPALPTSARPAGLKGEIPAIAGMTTNSIID